MGGRQRRCKRGNRACLRLRFEKPTHHNGDRCIADEPAHAEPTCDGANVAITSMPSVQGCNRAMADEPANPQGGRASPALAERTNLIITIV
jgi:hypothetical protein